MKNFEPTLEIYLLYTKRVNRTFFNLNTSHPINYWLGFRLDLGSIVFHFGYRVPIYFFGTNYIASHAFLLLCGNYFCGNLTTTIGSWSCTRDNLCCRLRNNFSRYHSCSCCFTILATSNEQERKREQIKVNLLHIKL